MRLSKHFLLVVIIGIIHSLSLSYAQRTPYPIKKDTISGDAFIRIVDQSLSLYYQDYLSRNNKSDSIIDALEYEANTIPQFSDDIYCKRLAKMNETSSFGFDCNATSLSVIKFFADKRRNFAKVVLGRSQLYFELYEEKLSEYNLPLELKYLSVIESGLRPQVKSRAGATGLWQFMYATGKESGLVENSYLDERMDPVKSTDAACRYLKKLFDIYGDWNLALAAYNAGPGNVNKAIRRSGGKRTYWEIRPFLPRETQGYVPNFIAAAYLLTYHAEHNILPAPAKIHYAQLDTMCLQRGIHMQTIERMIAWSTEDIKELNPVYKATYIPPTTPKQCITGPLDKIGLLVSLEDSLYLVEKAMYGSGGTPVYIPNNPANNTAIVTNPTIEDRIVVSQPVEKKEIPKTKVVTSIKYTYHRVKTGESLGKIAAQYSCAIQEIVEWNNLSGTQVNVGQMLKIQSKTTTTIDNPEYLESINPTVQDTVIEVQQTVTPTTNPAVEARKRYYTIRGGDTYSKIAGKHGLTVNQLKKLNPGVVPARIQAGQQVRVK